jgi:hypothetical protein
MQNLQGKRPKIKPSEFFGLILEPTAKNLWSMVDMYLVILLYLHLFVCSFGSEIYLNVNVMPKV